MRTFQTVVLGVVTLCGVVGCAESVLGDLLGGTPSAGPSLSPPSTMAQPSASVATIAIVNFKAVLADTNDTIHLDWGSVPMGTDKVDISRSGKGKIMTLFTDYLNGGRTKQTKQSLFDNDVVAGEKYIYYINVLSDDGTLLAVGKTEPILVPATSTNVPTVVPSAAPVPTTPPVAPTGLLATTPEPTARLSSTPFATLAPKTTDISTLGETTLNGIVFDNSGVPLNGVKIMVRSLNPSVPLASETTTAPMYSTVYSLNGWYVFNGLPSGIQVEITATKSGFTTSRRVEVPKLGNLNNYDFGAANTKNHPLALSKLSLDNTAFTLNSASAMKNPDFSYTISITGTGMGALADYKFMQVKLSSATIALIVDGEPRQNLELFEISLTATELKFRFKFESPPVTGDQIELSFEKAGASSVISIPIRLDSVKH